jgi:hypothetical protein
MQAARKAATLAEHGITRVVDLTAKGIDYEGFNHPGVEYHRVDIQVRLGRIIASDIEAPNLLVNLV